MIHHGNQRGGQYVDIAGFRVNLPISGSSDTPSEGR
jgi:hypothetical protein